MLELKDFPIIIEENVIYNKDKKVLFNFSNKITLKEKDFIKKLCLCANYGKRALLIKKMRSFDLPLSDAEDIAITECLLLGFRPCKQGEEDLEFTIISYDSKDINIPKTKRVLYFKK